MKAVRCIFALAVCACLIPVLASASETERFHKVVPIGAGGSLTLHNFSGAVRIVGADVSEITIDAVRVAPRDRLDHIKLVVEATGSSVAIDANKRDDGWEGGHRNNVVDTTFDIQVPRSVSLDINVFSSPVNVKDVTGAQSIHTFSGTIEAENAPARFSAKTFSGAVRLHLAGQASSPDLDLETFSGDIGVNMPESASASVRFDSFRGRLTSDLPLTVHSQKRGHLRADLGGGDARHTVNLKTFSGDVTITK
ncbi:MAG TPA: DUF4097 family beta strand repeat-containing protein [Vicinamibacterales bacterium]|jgi:hypothetical protein